MPCKPSLHTAIGVVLLAALTSCTENTAHTERPVPPPLADEPIHVQIQRAEKRLGGMPFRVLLDFEKNYDLAFLSPRQSLRLSEDVAHTGKRSMELHPSAGILTVKMSSVLGAALPGNWTVTGAYFHSKEAATVTVTYGSTAGGTLAQGHSVKLVPGKWTAVMMDLTTDPGRLADRGLITFSVSASSPVYCDDLVVMNNAKTWVTRDQQDKEGWEINQSGFSVTAQRPGAFRMVMKTPEASEEGWSVEEANDVRLRCASASGKVMAIYPDGRQYLDGEFRWLAAAAISVKDLYAQQHAAPADLHVPEELGRVNRDTVGDRNNDGYNEQRGAYQITASGPRLELKLTPRSKLLCRPVLEITGLPPGKALVTVEGRLVERMTRLPDGTLLLELPITLEREVTVSLGVRN